MASVFPTTVSPEAAEDPESSEDVAEDRERVGPAGIEIGTFDA